ncbi:hypothetical protein JOF41_006725 [Saccharothrix coeruleofusca]|uniref:hypothetical protein n=1 Tax=Saccharothrix coeruleofusca TaxID=33919 RepID=UPI001AEB4AED|nr:hypothetical protein [Saccharothrix coeruleofusca]MBP2340547.1 hypothetical protein [Saccharothrix coeruleofusca]
MLARVIVGAALGAGLGAAWWGLREFIASGAACSKDDWDCLGLGLLAIPVSLVVGVLVGWVVLAAAKVERPLGMAAVGTAFTAVLTLLTIWFPVTSGSVLTGALGFALAAPVTARHPAVRAARRPAGSSADPAANHG